MSDSTTLSRGDRKILGDLATRRKHFDEQLVRENRQHEFVTCLSCGFPTLSERGGFEICIICDWEDDQKDEFSGIPGGANKITLIDSQLKIGQELNSLADSLRGRIVTDLDTFLTITRQHETKMDSISESKLWNADISDPIWEEWRKARQSIKARLIVK